MAVLMLDEFDEELKVLVGYKSAQVQHNSDENRDDFERQFSCVLNAYRELLEKYVEQRHMAKSYLEAITRLATE